ncbi:hypothetical protein F2Q69_00044463 [Brassica cretica]|uniref:Uncharacterized protein n=1 Tax=Brassica cretica TaxID=69181 RepID=A0A8S9NWC4_BRACR|nr:hypothetical protein F2Q69_00044463 [Brassica cretica]
MDSSLAVTRCRSFSRSRSDRSLAVTRLALSQSLGADRLLAVARIDLSRSLDSLSFSFSVRIALLRLLVMDTSLAVTRRISFSCSRSDRSLAVTRLALLQLLVTYRSLVVTRHGSLSRSYSARNALSQSLGLLASLEHDVIPRRHIHPCDLIVMVRSWWYVHDDVYGNLSLAFCRLTLHPWQLAPVVQNTVLTDHSRNNPGVGSLIGIRSMSMTARPRQSVYDASSMAT